MDVRYAEDLHDFVTDELLHGPPMALDDGPHLIEVAGHDSSHRLGIESFGKLGGRHDVRKEDRDGLSYEHFVESRPETSCVLGRDRPSVTLEAHLSDSSGRPGSATQGAKRSRRSIGFGRRFASSGRLGPEYPRQESNLRTWFRKPLLFR